MINIVLNGQSHRVASTNLQQLLESQQGGNERVAVAVNESFVPRAQYAEIRLNEGDRVELVVPMQGG